MKTFFENRIANVLSTTFLSCLVLFANNAFSQVPAVSNPACAYCGSQNGVHSSTCPYYVAPTNSSNTSNNSDNPINSTSNALPNPMQVLTTGTALSPEQQRALEEQRLNDVKIAVEKKRINDEKVQKDHEKLMQSYKTLDEPKASNTSPVNKTDSASKAVNLESFSLKNLTVYVDNGWIIKARNDGEYTLTYGFTYVTEGTNKNGDVVFSDTAGYKNLTIKPHEENRIITSPQDPQREITYIFKDIRVTMCAIKP